jgi:carbonic anhydrase/acetyltransferase-like protein (isoleucine patch superfamily)
MRDRDPVVAPDAFVASSAVLVGDVHVGPATVIDRRSTAAVAAEIRQRSP